MNCLIGYTGFVGGNLVAQRTFDVLVNSKNFETMRGQRYDRVICAGVVQQRICIPDRHELHRRRYAVRVGRGVFEGEGAPEVRVNSGICRLILLTSQNKILTSLATPAEGALRQQITATASDAVDDKRETCVQVVVYPTRMAAAKANLIRN